MINEIIKNLSICNLNNSTDYTFLRNSDPKTFCFGSSLQSKKLNKQI